MKSRLTAALQRASVMRDELLVAAVAHMGQTRVRELAPQLFDDGAFLIGQYFGFDFFDAEFAGDVFVGVARRDQHEDFSLPRGEAGL